MTRRICAIDKSAEKYYLPDLPPLSDQTSLDKEINTILLAEN